MQFGDGPRRHLIKIKGGNAMHKNLTKPHVINDRLETPTGLVGVPPEAAMLGGDDTYIIVTDRKTANRIIDEIFSSKNKSLPQ